MFRPEELELLLTGSDEFDFTALQSVTRYEGFTSESKAIVNFWEIVHDFSIANQKKLLQFATGRYGIRRIRFNL